MPNWCSNRLCINGPKERVAEVKKLMEGKLHPFHQEAIQRSIKLFVAGCAGVLKPLVVKACPLYPDLISQGVGEVCEENRAYSEWLDLFISDPSLTEDVSRTILDAYSRTGLALRNWDSFSAEEQAVIQELYQKKRFDWSDNVFASVSVEQWWQQLDESTKGIPFDMRFLLPTKLAAEINGFNGELLDTHSTYDLYRNLYGIKWPMGYSLSIDSDAESSDGAFIEVNFDTPWGPPQNEVFLQLSAQYSCDITHYYSEEGGGFCGFTDYASGRLCEGTCGSLEYGEEDADGCSEVIGPRYIVGNVQHYGG